MFATILPISNRAPAMNATQFSPADIETLKELRPGWEEVWWRVVLLLCGADGQSGPLCRNAKKVCARQKHIITDADLVSFKLDYYYERLQRNNAAYSIGLVVPSVVGV